MRLVTLTADEVMHGQALARDVADRYTSVEDQDFLQQAAVFAHELPRRLRSEILQFRLAETDGTCLVRGYEVDVERIGPTPEHWNVSGHPSPALEEEIFFFLCASLLGDAIAWATQQDGHLMHDVFPIKEHEHEQLGSGSQELLTWHTEDAFHPLRADYLGLFCLRNRDRVETTYAALEDVKVSERAGQVLRQRLFPIRPDRSHLPENRSRTAHRTPEAAELLKRSYEWIERLDADPERIAVLFGQEQSPYLRIDPYFMETDSLDREARHALAVIVAAIDRALTGYPLAPGEIVFLDNYRAVHGRRPFTARFDGTDRWLKRLNLSRDLRKSRAQRLSAESRTIH